MLVTVFRGISVSENSVKIGKKGKEKACLEHQAERGFCHAFFQFPEELIPDPRWGAFFYLFPVSQNGLIGLFFNMESGSRGVTDDPYHPDRIVLESFIRVPDHTNHLPIEIGHSTHIVDNRKIGNIVKEAVDCDVPAEGILYRRSETFTPDDLTFLRLYLFEFGPASKGGDFYDFPAFEKDMNQTEPAANHPAIFKEGLYLMGMGIGGDIEIFRRLSEKEVSNASSDQVG